MMALLLYYDHSQPNRFMQLTREMSQVASFLSPKTAMITAPIQPTSPSSVLA